jgi:hypothetical protein
MMTFHERYMETLLFGAPDKVPLLPGGPRESTLKVWYQQGFPEGKDFYQAMLEELGLPQMAIEMDGPGVFFGLLPFFEEKVLEHKDGHYIVQDWMGAITEISDEYDYTYIRAADNRRVVIPNEQLSSKVVHNYTIVEQASAATVDFSVPPVAALADISRVALEEAARFTRGEDGREPTLTVLEIAFDQVRLRITLWAADRPTAESVAATLRGALMERLESEGLLAPAAPGS